MADAERQNGDKKLIVQARERFRVAKEASVDQRRDFKESMRMTFGEQWDTATKTARVKAGRPALSFPVLHTYVQRITNQARKERPQPKVNAVGEGASQQVADVYEGLFRHVHTASNADVAYDGAVETAAAGGWGFYEFTTEYVDDESFDQEPRIRRVLDPLSVFFDPHAMEPDYSDAKYYFKRRRMTKEDFKLEFDEEPESDWDDEDARQDWTDGEDVFVAEYCYVEGKVRDLWLMADGTKAFKEVIESEGRHVGQKPTQSRKIVEKVIRKCILDGSRVLERTTWLGKWLPMVPVLGKEVVVEEKRRLFSAVHFSLDSQKLINATGSGIAEQLQLASRAPWVGAKGSMKDKRWDDNSQNFSKLEYEPFNEDGMPLPPPQRNAYEAPIQALTQAKMVYTDDIRKSIGYVDGLVNPSQSDLSGIAVKRRDAQSDLANFHFEDNLVRSQWHGGRILLDLLQKYIDTPRAMRILAPDGTVSMQAITMAMDGGIVPMVQGYEDKPHVRMDVGKYDVTISTGPGYASRLESEIDVLLKSFAADPQLWGIAGDLLFKAMGYPDLEARLRMALPPQIQEALANKEANISPEAQAKIMQMAQQNQALQQQMQQLVAALQKLMMEREAKIIDNQAKVLVTQMNNESREKIAAASNATDVAVQDRKHGQESAAMVYESDQQMRLEINRLLHDATQTLAGHGLEREKMATSAQLALMKPAPTKRTN